MYFACGAQSKPFDDIFSIRAIFHEIFDEEVLISTKAATFKYIANFCLNHRLLDLEFHFSSPFLPY